MAGNINRVILTGNLTRDPEIRNMTNGTAVCKLGIAVNGRRRNEAGQWEDDPNYFNITVFGQQAENCKRYLEKGRPVAVDGRLNWHQWESEGQKRSAVDIIAETVQFLGGRGDAPSGGNANGFSSGAPAAVASDIPIDTNDFVSTPAAASAADEDIPF